MGKGEAYEEQLGNALEHLGIASRDGAGFRGKGDLETCFLECGKGHGRLYDTVSGRRRA